MNITHRISLLRTASLFFVLCYSITLPAQQNLLENPGFENDLSGWDNPESRSGQWDSKDAANSVMSGSAYLANEHPGNNASATVLQQCIPAEPNTEYEFGGQTNIPPGQPEGTQTAIFFVTYSAENAHCGSSSLQIDAIEVSPMDQWQTDMKTVTTHADTAAIKITLGLSKAQGEMADAWGYFDNIFLRKSGTGGRVIDEKLNGSWFNPSTAGQGLFLDISTEINLFFGGWFGWTTTLGDINWTTIQGGFSGEVATFTIYQSSGGKFNDPAPVTNDPVGVGEFRALSCTEAMLSVQFNGEEAMTDIDLTKIGPAAPGCVDS